MARKKSSIKAPDASCSKPLPLPVIVEPFATFKDEVAGNTVDEIATNLLLCTRFAVRNRLQPKRPLYTLAELRDFFRGHVLTEESKNACREVSRTYDRIIAYHAKYTKPTPAPVPETPPDDA